MKFNTSLIFIASALIGGTTAGLVKFASFEFTPGLLVLLRTLLASLILAPFLYKKAKVKKEHLKLIFLTSTLFATNVIFFVYGIQRTSIIMGQLIYIPMALVVVLLSAIFLHDKISGKQVAGIVATITGMSVLFFGSVLTKDVLSFGTPFGNLLIIIAFLSWATYMVTTKKLTEYYSPLVITFYNLIITTGLSLIFLPISLRIQPVELSRIRIEGIVGLLALSIFSTIIFFYFNQVIIKRASPFVASLIFYSTALTATLVGVIFFQEKITTLLIVGALFIILGVFISTKK